MSTKIIIGIDETNRMNGFVYAWIGCDFMHQSELMSTAWTCACENYRKNNKLNFHQVQWVCVCFYIYVNKWMHIKHYGFDVSHMNWVEKECEEKPIS